MGLGPDGGTYPERLGSKSGVMAQIQNVDHLMLERVMDIFGENLVILAAYLNQLTIGLI